MDYLKQDSGGGATDHQFEDAVGKMAAPKRPNHQTHIKNEWNTSNIQNAQTGVRQLPCSVMPPTDTEHKKNGSKEPRFETVRVHEGSHVHFGPLPSSPTQKNHVQYGPVVGSPRSDTAFTDAAIAWVSEPRDWVFSQALMHPLQNLERWERLMLCHLHSSNEIHHSALNTGADGSTCNKSHVPGQSCSRLPIQMIDLEISTHHETQKTRRNTNT